MEHGQNEYLPNAEKLGLLSDENHHLLFEQSFTPEHEAMVSLFRHLFVSLSQASLSSANRLRLPLI